MVTETTDYDFDDQMVIHRVLNGEADAFELLLKKYRELVFMITAHHVPSDQVEEVAQDAFVRAYQSLRSYKGHGDFRHWLTVITTRTCHDFWRKRYRNKEVNISSISDEHQQWLDSTTAVTASAVNDDRDTKEDVKSMMDWALNQLNPSDRMVLELIYLEELSIKETAEMLDLSQTNVKVRAFRARQKMQKLIKEQDRSRV